MSDQQHPDQNNKQLSTKMSSADQVGMFQGIYENATLTWRLFWDRRVSPLAKAVPVAGVVYIISPIDAMPLIPLDDAGVLVFVLAFLTAFIKLSPPDVVAEHRRALGYSGTPAADYDDGNVIDGEVEEYDG